MALALKDLLETKRATFELINRKLDTSKGVCIVLYVVGFCAVRKKMPFLILLTTNLDSGQTKIYVCMKCQYYISKIMYFIF